VVLGGVLVQFVGFEAAVAVLLVLVLLIIPVPLFVMDRDLGLGNKKTARFSMEVFKKTKNVNVLSLARFFLFGARDVWYEIACPIFLSSVLLWPDFTGIFYFGHFGLLYSVVSMGSLLPLSLSLSLMGKLTHTHTHTHTQHTHRDRPTLAGCLRTFVHLTLSVFRFAVLPFCRFACCASGALLWWICLSVRVLSDRIRAFVQKRSSYRDERCQVGGCKCGSNCRLGLHPLRALPRETRRSGLQGVSMVCHPFVCDLVFPPFPLFR
jgi:hypothetical protein